MGCLIEDNYREVLVLPSEQGAVYVSGIVIRLSRRCVIFSDPYARGIQKLVASPITCSIHMLLANLSFR